ncbi:hypothetical protein G9A89_020468 [Geosiphon pyriformis]|nr:hypothetical protein G9A89_020468 [Geosiphon pyriformis]
MENNITMSFNNKIETKRYSSYLNQKQNFFFKFFLLSISVTIVLVSVPTNATPLSQFTKRQLSDLVAFQMESSPTSNLGENNDLTFDLGQNTFPQTDIFGMNKNLETSTGQKVGALPNSLDQSNNENQNIFQIGNNLGFDLSSFDNQVPVGSTSRAITDMASLPQDQFFENNNNLSSDETNSQFLAFTDQPSSNENEFGQSNTGGFDIAAASGGKSLVDRALENELAKYAKYASDAYCPDTEMHVITGNMRAAVIDNFNGLLVIIFQGAIHATDNALFQDSAMVDFPLAPNAKVHHGFYAAVNSGKKNLVNFFKNTAGVTSDSNVILTGHNSGGALALFSALLVLKSELKPKTIQIFTYGQPRVGNKGFAEYVNREIPDLYRVINGKDTVANSPSRGSTGWVHHEKEYWIDPKSKKTYSCPGTFDGSGNFVDESQECLNAPGQYNSALNAGPYFSITMGKTCLPPGRRPRC